MNIGILFAIAIIFVVGNLEGRFLLVQVGDEANVGYYESQLDADGVNGPIRQGMNIQNNDTPIKNWLSFHFSKIKLIIKLRLKISTIIDVVLIRR